MYLFWNFVFVIANLLYLFVIYRVFYRKDIMQKYYLLARIAFIVVIAINAYYQSITLSVIDTIVFIAIEPYRKIVYSMEENKDISESRLLLKINYGSTDNILTYSFWGAVVVLLIGLAIFIVLFYICRDNPITNNLYNSFIDILQLLLTSVVLVVALDNLENKRMLPRKIMGIMIAIFFAYMIVDTLSGMVNQTSESILKYNISHVKKGKTNRNLTVKVKGKNVIVKIPKNIVKNELNKK